ncbi:MAG: amino acid ABC transporter substrate-binding protein [Kaistia sp. SCN 65-12]|nr:MAG: amino acid ABC transporter substrate-binding protein [Kaistia sp. SCN 65-12]
MAADGATQTDEGVALVTPYLCVRDLVKRFSTFTALDGVSLDVLPGEFVCFLGPSGCGKTTLLRSIAGLDPHTSGTITQGGRDVSHLPPAARDFGIVFQSYALFPNLTVAANVGYGLTSRRRSRAETADRVAQLLALVGLADQGAKYPGQLSGGQQQRVALARALATSPGLLLLDEPLSALDARVRVRLRQQIKDLQRRVGVTTIMVTHDQEEALTMADRIVVMNRGAIEQIGSPTEIYRNPASVFVADFIGAMTFISAEAVDATHVRAGQLLFETSSYSIQQGSTVTVGIRPEEVRVRNLDAQATNRIDTRIDTLEFLGGFARARLVPVAAPQLHVLADFSVNALRDLSLTAGQPLSIVLPPETLRVFPISQ